ncbi:hypothetical protein GCM10027020_34140 [Nocardioides salsibiostraticola]
MTLSALAVAAPQASAAGAAASAVPTTVAASAAVAAAQPPKKTFEVKNLAQLNRAVRRANRSGGKDKIVLTGNVVFPKKGRSPDVDVFDDLVIEGNGKTINGQNIDRIFDVRPDNRVVIKDATLKKGQPANGEDGGAIRNAGELVLKNVVIRDSMVTGDGASGGAIVNYDGKVKVKRSSLTDNRSSRAGGAIETNGGRVAVVKSTLSGNDAGLAPGNGGAIHTTGDGTVVLKGSTISGNFAAAEGGGLWNSLTGAMGVNDSTVTLNVAGGNDADQGGGGIYNDGGSLFVQSKSIVSENAATGSAGSGGGLFNNGGALTVRGLSEVNDNDAVRAGGGIEALAGTTALSGVKLNNNGTGSAPGNGGGLHLTGAGTVGVADSQVSGNVAINEGGGLWNSATGQMGVSDSSITDNEARGAAADSGGGGIYNDGELGVLRGEIDGNTATGAAGSGGGILNQGGGALIVDETTVSNNTANRAGGGIELAALEGAASGATLTDVILDGNSVGTAPGNGGGLHLGGASTATITDGAVTNNTAVEGGGLWNSAAGDMTVDGTSFTGNTATGADADQGGGALYDDGGTLTVTDAQIDGNSATGAAGSGGGILTKGDLTVSGSDFDANTSKRAGGGIENATGSSSVLTDVDFTNNTTGANPGNGGAIHAGGTANVTYTGGTVSGNTAAKDGGGLWNGNGVFTATGITFGPPANAAGTEGEGDDAYNEEGGGVMTVNGTVVAPGTGIPVGP